MGVACVSACVGVSVSLWFLFPQICPPSMYPVFRPPLSNQHFREPRNPKPETTHTMMIRIFHLHSLSRQHVNSREPASLTPRPNHGMSCF